MSKKDVITENKMGDRLKSIIETRFRPDERMEIWFQLQSLINSKK